MDEKAHYCNLKERNDAMRIKPLKKIMLSGLAVFGLAMSSGPAVAGVDISIGISLPPPIQFSAPPQMVALPDTNVYVAPDVQEDIFFSGGWWWRLWGGRWYRSRSYDRGWGYVGHAPTFYHSVPRDWRRSYHDRVWNGRPWRQERVRHQEVQQNWRNWEKENHWAGQRGPEVRGVNPHDQHPDRPGFRPDVRHEERPDVRHEERQPQGWQNQSRRQGQQPQGWQNQSRRQGRQPQEQQKQSPQQQDKHQQNSDRGNRGQGNNDQGNGHGQWQQ
jgi:hypothetical protein